VNLSSRVRGRVGRVTSWNWAIVAALVMLGACSVDEPEVEPQAAERELRGTGPAITESTVAISVSSSNFRVFEGDVGGVSCSADSSTRTGPR